jgi:hypothetical protein
MRAALVESLILIVRPGDQVERTQSEPSDPWYPLHVVRVGMRIVAMVLPEATVNYQALAENETLVVPMEDE